MIRLRARVSSLVLLVILFGGAVVVACEDTSPDVPCMNIPLGGCPNGGADACQDSTCYNIFNCVSGNWTLDHACPRPDAGGDNSLDAAPEAQEQSAFDARGIDAPPGAGGGPGCIDLEMPDCALEVALVCSSSDCCGCQDLFVCQPSGWVAWGTCSADAGVVPG